MRIHEQWQLHCTSQWGWETPLREHVYCVAIAFKMTEWVEQWICIKFCVSLNIPPLKLFLWFGRLQLWATGDWLLHHNNMATSSQLCSSMQSFFGKHQITQVTQPHYSPNLAPCDIWLFLKLKSHLKGKRFQTINEIQEYTTGQLIEVGGTVWGPKVPTLKGTEVSLSYVHCFLYPVFSSINVSIFCIIWLDTYWTDLVQIIYHSNVYLKPIWPY